VVCDDDIAAETKLLHGEAVDVDLRAPKRVG